MATYKKVSGLSQGVGGYTRLWISEDHLLLVTTSGISEEYRRLYYTDIQAFIVRKTVLGLIGSCILGGLAALFLFLALVVGSDSGMVALLIVAACCGLAVLVNTLLGPTCTCYVHTATARHSVPPLQRLRNARKLLDKILPLITAAQGEVTAEQLNSRSAVPSYPEAPPVIS